MDEIIIEKLRVFCNHGVYEEEQKEGQNFYVTAKIYLNTYAAGRTDDLDKTINYADICQLITDFMCGTRFKLIEAVAEGLSDRIMNYSPIIKGVELTVNKPEAPVELPFENICVKIKRMWHPVLISFGSNIGNKQKYLEDAFHSIKENKAIKDVKISSIKITKPYGGVEQDDFLNGCMSILTYMEPEVLLEFLNKLELEAGRVRNLRWGPRTLDLDIIFYDEEIIHTEKLIVPHIDMHNRTFVLEPLCEIAPYAYHPILKKTVYQLLEDYKKIKGK